MEKQSDVPKNFKFAGGDLEMRTVIGTVMGRRRKRGPRAVELLRSAVGWLTEDVSHRSL
jgi:hypothetical protein